MLTILKPIFALFAIAFVMAMYQPRQRQAVAVNPLSPEQERWKARTERSKAKIKEEEADFARTARLGGVS